jgi:hypothetical protein
MGRVTTRISKGLQIKSTYRRRERKPPKLPGARAASINKIGKGCRKRWSRDGKESFHLQYGLFPRSCSDSHPNTNCNPRVPLQGPILPFRNSWSQGAREYHHKAFFHLSARSMEEAGIDAVTWVSQLSPSWPLSQTLSVTGPACAQPSLRDHFFWVPDVFNSPCCMLLTRVPSISENPGYHMPWNNSWYSNYTISELGRIGGEALVPFTELREKTEGWKGKWAAWMSPCS